MATKFVRGLIYQMDSTGTELSAILRMTYEFWGYCVNGTSSLSVPGGVPTPNGTLGPSNFFENTPNVTLPVMLAGSDGTTTLGSSTFGSVTGGFTAAMAGKYITIWKKQKDGSWRVVADIGNATPAARTN